MAEKTVNVRLPKKLEKGRQGYVDPENGIMISKAKYRHGCQLVPNTSFIQAKINSGALIKVDEPSKSRSEEADTPGDELVAVTLGTNMKIAGEKRKAGETVQVPAAEAEQLILEGKAVAA